MAKHKEGVGELLEIFVRFEGALNLMKKVIELSNKPNLSTDDLEAVCKLFDKLGHCSVEVIAEKINTALVEKQLTQSNRLAAVGEFALGLIHDINNLNCSVLGNMELLAKDIDRDEVKDALEAAKRCGVLCSQVAQFVRGDSPAPTVILLSDVLDNILRLMDNRIRVANVTVEKRVQEPLSVKGVRIELEQVFLNLITNSVQAMMKGGVLTITVKRVNDMVLVEFSDTGIGISPENVKSVFTPFFSTKPAGKGIGLGLAVSRKIVEKNGGTIELLSSGKGKGATFRILLPVFGG